MQHSIPDPATPLKPNEIITARNTVLQGETQRMIHELQDSQKSLDVEIQQVIQTIPQFIERRQNFEWQMKPCMMPV
jgi:hypothetical protein